MLWTWLFWVAGLLVLACFALGYLIFRKTLCRGARLAPTGRSHRGPETRRLNAEAFAALEAAGLGELWLDQGGIRLHAYSLDQGSPVTALLCHGYGSGPEARAKDAEFYASLGFNLLLPHNRGHGLSGGKYLGMGAYEREDLSLWCDRLLEGTDGRILLDGVSMGAASVVLACAHRRSRGIAAVVCDSCFSSGWAAVCHRTRKKWRLPPFPLLYITDLFCRLFAGYSLRQSSPLAVIGEVSCPILFLHGEQDRLVPPAMAEQLFSAARGDKELLIVPGAGHGAARRAAPGLCAGKQRALLGRAGLL